MLERITAAVARREAAHRADSAAKLALKELNDAMDRHPDRVALNAAWAAEREFNHPNSVRGNALRIAADAACEKDFASHAAAWKDGRGEELLQATRASYAELRAARDAVEVLLLSLLTEPCGYCRERVAPVRNEAGWLSCPACGGV